jgi:hypothetical protein
MEMTACFYAECEQSGLTEIIKKHGDKEWKPELAVT